MTPARERLAHLHKARAAAAAEVAEAQARVSRLRALADAAAPVKARLAALDAEEAARFSVWAKSEADAPPPAADNAARIDLQRELADAEARAAAASRALSGVEHEKAQAAAKAAAVEAAIPVAAAHAVLEELATIGEEARAAVAAIGTLRVKGQVILRQVDGALRSLGAFNASGPQQPDIAELQAAWVAAGAAVADAFALPLHDEAAELEFIRKVSGHLLALRSDAGAKLGDAAKRGHADTYATAVPSAQLDPESAAALCGFRGIWAKD